MDNHIMSLYEQLNQYGDSDYYPYHMPGHKRRSRGHLPRELLKLDITEIDGFDNLHHATGILQDLQQRAASLYGADESFYLVNGSTGGILSAISAAVEENGTILMARNSHKSAYHAAYLRNLTINYLYPPVWREYDIYDALQPEQVREALDANPRIQAVFLVSPTYEGRIADIKGIAEVVHERGIPLIVDEAHGAHLGWAEGFAPGSCTQGADLVIHSVHKTLPAPTQTALLHVNGDLIDRTRLRRFLQIYQTSSPSYILMAGIEDALRIAEEQRDLFDTFRERYTAMLENLQNCRYLSFLPSDPRRQDIGKLVISGRKARWSGQQIYDYLLKEEHLQLEMAAGSYCLAMFTIGDTPEGYERMQQALFRLDQEIGSSKSNQRDLNQEMGSSESDQNLEIRSSESPPNQESREEAYGIWQKTPGDQLPLTRAWDMPWAWAPLEEALDQYAADFVYLYPPGSPLLVPGEWIEEIDIGTLGHYLQQGLNVQGICSTKQGYYIKIIKKEKGTTEGFLEMEKQA